MPQAPKTTGPVELFCSYAHEDEPHREALETHLSALRREGVLAVWHDRMVDAGSEWAGQIDEHINSAGIILLLVSADFINSNYCFDIEMKRALERHQRREARVIPIIVRPCEWEETPLGRLQALPRGAKPITTWANEDEALHDVARGIRRLVKGRVFSRDGAGALSPRQDSCRKPTKSLWLWTSGALTVMAGLILTTQMPAKSGPGVSGTAAPVRPDTPETLPSSGVAVPPVPTAGVRSTVSVSVTWSWTMTRNDMELKSILRLKQEGDKLTGTLTTPGHDGDGAKAEISDGKVTADGISFKVVREFNGNKMEAIYTGKVDGDKLNLKVEIERDGEKMSRDFEAKREPEEA